MSEATENNGAGAKELPELNDVSQASDHVGPLKAAMRSGALALLVLGALSLLVLSLIHI